MEEIEQPKPIFVEKYFKLIGFAIIYTAIFLVIFAIMDFIVTRQFSIISIVLACLGIPLAMVFIMIAENTPQVTIKGIVEYVNRNEKALYKKICKI